MKFLETGPEVRARAIRGGAMLYDTSRAGNATEAWLDLEAWRARGQVTPLGEGRGSAWLIEADGRELVLRHYQRGGLMAPLFGDRYWWRGEEQTRCFREWRLLYQLHRVGMPVPTPLVAGYRRVGNGYTADILTERIRGTRSLAQALGEAPLSLDAWGRIGRWLRRFHLRGVCHADLNAHNILVSESGPVWLIDFDRGSLRVPGWWCDANLVRLRRSLEKLAARLPAEHFTANDWHLLLDAYLAAGSELPPTAPSSASPLGF